MRKLQPSPQLFALIQYRLIGFNYIMEVDPEVGKK